VKHNLVWETKVANVTCIKLLISFARVN